MPSRPPPGSRAAVGAPGRKGRAGTERIAPRPFVSLTASDALPGDRDGRGIGDRGEDLPLQVLVVARRERLVFDESERPPSIGLSTIIAAVSGSTAYTAPRSTRAEPHRIGRRHAAIDKRRRCTANATWY